MSDEITVGQLRQALEGLPDDMPVLGGFGVDGSAYDCTTAEVCDARAVDIKGHGCAAPYAVSVHEEMEKADGTPWFGVHHEYCCGIRSHGPTFQVFWIS